MPGNPSAPAMDRISATQGEPERASQWRVMASIVGSSTCSDEGSHARQSSRSARARARPSMAWRTGPPSRMSVTGMSTLLLIADSQTLGPSQDIRYIATCILCGAWRGGIQVYQPVVKLFGVITLAALAAASAAAGDDDF